MSFEELKQRQTQDAVLAYLGLTEEDLQRLMLGEDYEEDESLKDPEAPKDWDEHEQIVADVEEPVELTRNEKLVAVVDLNLDMLLAGAIAIENAQELQDLIAAVDSLDCVLAD